MVMMNGNSAAVSNGTSATAASNSEEVVGMKDTDSPSDSVSSDVSEDDDESSSEDSSDFSDEEDGESEYIPDGGSTSEHDSDRMTDRSSALGGGNGGKTGCEQKREVKQVKKLSQAETNSIRFWRVVVMGLLIVAGVAVSAGTYVFLTNSQTTEYLNKYSLFTLTIDDSAQFHINNMYEAVHAFCDQISAAPKVLTTYTTPNEAFPYVTVPNFELIARQTRLRSGIESILYSPVVSQEESALWSEYAVANAATWIQQSNSLESSSKQQTQRRRTLQADQSSTTTTANDDDTVVQQSFRVEIVPFIYELNSTTGEKTPSPKPGPYAPVWQTSPVPQQTTFLNFDLMQLPEWRQVMPALSFSGEALFTSILDIYPVYDAMGLAEEMETKLNHVGGAFADILSDATAGTNESVETEGRQPHSVLVSPVFKNLNDHNSGIVGVTSFIVTWYAYLTNLLPQGVTGIVVVISNDCNQSMTYGLNGNLPFFMGLGDLHDPAFSDTRVTVPLYQYFWENNVTSMGLGGHCEYVFHIYASAEFQQNQTDNIPAIFTAIVAVIFFMVVMTFIVYDGFVQRRNTKVVHAAARSNAILSSLFPSNVRDRLFAETENAVNAAAKGGKGANVSPSPHTPAAKSRLRNFLDSTDGKNGSTTGVDGTVGGERLGYEGKPIADLFPETSVLFGDIAGFTAWSSVREPAQVFTLLETLYRAFDEIAHRRRVFKVETVGDCYVAVTGLPDPQKDHAVIMARFARDCMYRCRHLTKKLETTLGPDTGDLNMRMGIHSGQVTGGVLRGERSRFQLFGDTMNTASRMESTGEAGKIQVSQETADLLIAAGKTEWVNLRAEKIIAKGKGEMQTYWLSLLEQTSETTSAADQSVHSSQGLKEGTTMEESKTQEQPEESKVFTISNSRTTRLIEWNVDVLLRLLKQIVARRSAYGEYPPGTLMANETQFELHHAESGKTAIDEVKEIITLPKFDPKVATRQEDPDNINLPTEVVDQLYDYVSNIAAIYNENPFHNFEHASHVTMSVVKLLSRIVAPNEVEYDDDNVKTGQSLHDHTYGITSDPLTQFACVFSALIHDADHSGVPNVQLVNEKAHIAEFYKGKSVAEQNSVDLAWHLLMDDTYTDLRETIYQTDAELKRFRQLVVNSVMATDIVDKELKTLRNARWAKAFSEESVDNCSRDATNRKATIVIEHLIQASDVAHTMQHWHIYRKWNERFFMECYVAYKEGRAEKDPAEGWYQGEMGFYDFYIIPLAKKLKDCGVFGVSSDEYLNYAVRNRKEWEERGREVVDEMIEMVHQKVGRVQLAVISDPQQKHNAADTA